MSKDPLQKKDLHLNTTKRKSKPKNSPVKPSREITQTAIKNTGRGYHNRLLVGTITTGLIRMEWAMARYGQIVPTNWSMVTMNSHVPSYVPIEYSIDDGQNLIIKEVIEKEFEWLFLLEHDVILPPDAFMRLNEYIRNETHPVVSGLYFTKSIPAEPMIYRGRGNSFYTDWKQGDLVWADGVPTGCLLIHAGILREMWKDSPEYRTSDGRLTRRVFETPRKIWFDPQIGNFNTQAGTSDLDWCTRVIEGDYLTKAGWKDFAKKEFPFLVDTNLFCQQIDERGVKYPG